MKFILILFTILAFVINETLTQTPLTNGQTIASTISPGESILYSITVTPTMYSLLLELGGSTGSDRQTVEISPPLPIRSSSFPSPFIESNGLDLNGPHSSGSVCPGSVPPGVYILNVTTRSSEVQPFSLRVTWKDTNLTTTLSFSGPLCCFGSDFFSFESFTYDVSPGTNSITITGERTSDREASFLGDPQFLIRRGLCTTGQTFNDDYTFDIPANGPFTITIDQNSNPPLVPGRYFISPRSPVVFTPTGTQDSITFYICPNGNCPTGASTLPQSTSQPVISSANSFINYLAPTLWILQLLIHAIYMGDVITLY